MKSLIRTSLLDSQTNDKGEHMAKAFSETTGALKQFSTKHPHEPEVEPIFDKEGRCLICCQIVSEKKIASLKEELAEKNPPFEVKMHADNHDKERQVWITVLIGEKATKEEVLKALSDVSLDVAENFEDGKLAAKSS